LIEIVVSCKGSNLDGQSPGMTKKAAGRARTAVPRVAGATRERILEAAELLFSTRGPHDVPLREVVDLAKANVAAVNYHFGSKEQLFDEVVARSIQRLATSLEGALGQAAAAHPHGVPLPDVVAAFLRGGLGSELHQYLRLRTWMGLVDAKRAAELLAQYFDPVTNAYLAALGKQLPGTTQAELGWRLYLITAALVFTAFDANRLEALTGGRAKSTNVTDVVEHLVPMLVDGIRSRKTDGKKVSATKSKTRDAAR
jgi:AcrR family transcriptional regulator